ncbi:MAG: hypothetical protein AAFQ27_10110 [Pseudomonadota bacterium]
MSAARPEEGSEREPSLVESDPVIRGRVERVLAAHGRDTLEIVMQVAIDVLDAIDGDADLEDSDEDGQCSEEEISIAAEAWGSGIRHAGGPGCAISDPDSAVDDFRCDREGEDGI